MKPKIGCAIIGSGNIGTDLMVKVLRHSRVLDMKVLVGIDPESDGLARARRFGVATTAEGVAGLLKMPEWADVRVVFDATSAKAHRANYELIRSFPDKWVVDLTPAAIGPYVVPPVNLDAHREARNVNMVTCGGQATIPMVYAVHRVAPVLYGEIIASIASRSAGPGTRANIDEFTETTARAIEQVGGARQGKAIIVLNPADPPLIMRDTIFTLSPAEARSAKEGKAADITGTQEQIRQSISDMVRAVQQYVPGYRLKQEVQFEEIPAERPVFIDGLGHVHGLKTSIFLEVEGAGHYLPAYAGNLDIMTSAALATAERLITSNTPTLRHSNTL